jgi:hypothetical protein
MLSGIVFVGEEFDDEDVTMWPGRFLATWQSDDGDSHIEGPTGVSADEAIAWGREHAEVVLIRLGDSGEYHSAGTKQPTGWDAPLRVWPPGTEVPRRRDVRYAHMDLVSERPIEWEVRMEPRLFGTRAEDHAERIGAVLDASPEAGHGAVQASEEPQCFSIRFTVEAQNYTSARELAFKVHDRLLEVLPLPAVTTGEGSFCVPTGLDPFDGIRPLSQPS